MIPATCWALLSCRRSHQVIRPLGVKLLTLGGALAQALTLEDETVRVVDQAVEDVEPEHGI
jgi:hypothetical protein